MSQRGGKRTGAGRPSVWTSGCRQEDTTTVRVPKKIAKQVKAIAVELDAGKTIQDIADQVAQVRKECQENNQKTATALAELLAGNSEYEQLELPTGERIKDLEV